VKRDLWSKFKGRIVFALGVLGVVNVGVAATGARFLPPTFYGVGEVPGNVVVMDFNNDGILDLATPNYGTYAASVLLGGEGGSFGQARNYPIGVNATTLLKGDFNRDGRTDLVSVNYSSFSISFLAGNGDGTFAGQREHSLGSYGSYVTGGDVADFDADGRLDVAIARYSSNQVSVLHGNGDGTFGREQVYRVGSYPYSVAVADLNRDQRPDLVVANGESTYLSVFLGTAGHTLAPAPDYRFNGQRASTVSVADMNRDGIPDLVVPTRWSHGLTGNLLILLGAGDGTFSEYASYPLDTWCIHAAVADFNGDRKLDVLTASFHTTAMQLFYGTGAGMLGAVDTLELGSNTRAVTAADFNGDGKPDFAASVGLDPQDPNARSKTNLLVVLSQSQVVPGSLIEDLLAELESLELPRGVERPLAAALEAALRSLERGQLHAAVNQLEAFQHKVEKQLQGDIADSLIAAAQAIIDSLSP
jgi:hypothetical protein